MKNIYLTLVLLFSVLVQAQTPGISYQAVIMNPKGSNVPGVNNSKAPLANKKICLRFKIIDGSTQTEYQETMNTTTDGYGMVNVVIGSGTQTGGYAQGFRQIAWNGAPKSLSVEVDFTNACTAFTLISKQPLTSVPYALFAANAGVPGVAGPKGDKGDKGDTGLTGATGAQGLKGDKGLTGDKGAQGLQGIQGVSGLKGDTGLTGATGAQGLKGDKGLTGDKGAQGLQGIQGVSGPKGDTGLTGATGAQGLKGDKGLTGDKGAQGLQGIQGVPGQKGDTGLTGATGAQGLKGDKGLTGDKGAQGLQGIQGVPGLKGDKGDTGLTGATGAQGLKGDKGLTGDKGAQGLQGIQGVSGPKGDIGLTGAQGLKGDKGLTGDKGAQGLQGIQGIKGDIGLTGAKGDTGAQGLKGDTGITGAKGDKGDTGLTGAKGDAGAQGLQGIQGIKGDTGLTGAKGDTGAQGLKGDTGITGAKGDNGAQGLQGLKGDKGDIGLTGAKGDTGVPGLQGVPGLKGDTGLTGAKGDTGAQGIQGDKGDTGANGIDGTNGTNGTDGINGSNTLVNTTTEPAGSNCTNGGTKVEVGLDANNSGVLDPSEVNGTLTKYVCNGISGIDGKNTLVNTTAEPAGVNCVNGGTKIEVGLDADNSGILDPSEVNGTLTKYVCNGVSGIINPSLINNGASNYSMLSGVKVPSFLSYYGDCSNGDKVCVNDELISNNSNYCNLTIPLGVTVKVAPAIRTIIYVQDTLYLYGNINGSGSNASVNTTNATSNHIGATASSYSLHNCSSGRSSSYGTGGDSLSLTWTANQAPSTIYQQFDGAISKVSGAGGCQFDCTIDKNGQDLTVSDLSKIMHFGSNISGVNGIATISGVGSASSCQVIALGGQGGGGLYLIAKKVVFTGSIQLNGGDGTMVVAPCQTAYRSASAGGGAGSCIISTESIVTNSGTFQATGGLSGNATCRTKGGNGSLIIVTP